MFAASAPEPLWSGDFRAPVNAPPTDSFGTRRIFNGKLASVHKGMDFRAPMGTPVRAGNSGVVVLARPLYYEGNCVVIDHGLGLFTISMHLSRIDVNEGQRVSTGERIGLSGATGRVTGPHLHWAVRWKDAYLDPRSCCGWIWARRIRVLSASRFTRMMLPCHFLQRSIAFAQVSRGGVEIPGSSASPRCLLGSGNRLSPHAPQKIRPIRPHPSELQIFPMRRPEQRTLDTASSATPK